MKGNELRAHGDDEKVTKNSETGRPRRIEENISK
jgi:hypothetical protein